VLPGARAARRLAAGCLLGAAACAEGAPPPAAPPPRLALEAVAGELPALPPGVRRAWGLVEPDLSHLDAPVGVKLDPLRRPAQVLAVPARLEAPLPEGVRSLRFWVAPPLGLDGDEACPVAIAAGGAGQEPERVERIEPAAAGPGAWREVELRVGAWRALAIAARAAEGCRAPTAVAVSEVRLEGEGAATPRPNLALVVIDTLRRDFMDCAATTRALTPQLARWCERGVFFADAHSSASWTYPALASMLTGQVPWEHRAGAVEGRLPLPRDVPTAAEALGRQGYGSAAIVSNWHAARGLWRGFDLFVELLPGSGPALAERRRAGRVVDAARAWLAGEPAQPFFLWLVLIDLHEPVDAVRVAGGAPAECAGVEPLPFQWQELGTPSEPPGPDEALRMRCRRALYREALRYVDAELARLAWDLEARGLDRETWILVASDHGEEFWDHAAEQRAAGDTNRGIWGIGHGHTLYGEILEVPLLLVPPRGTPGVPRRVPGLVAIDDVFPTLHGVGGAALSPGQAERNLARALGPDWGSGRESVASGALLYGPARRAVTTPGWRAVWTAPDRVQVFDRRADPGERQPLPEDAASAREGRRRLEALLRAAPPEAPAAPDAPPLDPADREALEALGYGRPGASGEGEGS